MILKLLIEEENIIFSEDWGIVEGGRREGETLHQSDLSRHVVEEKEKMNEITLRIRYKPNSKTNDISVQIDEDRLSCEVLAWKLAESATKKYLKYLGGEKDKKFERRYKLGQFKMIRNYLEAKI